MIIAVLEYPEDDQAQVYFVDIDKLDKNDPIQRHYYDNILEAYNSNDKISSTSFDASVFYGDDIFEPAITFFPCVVDGSITLYIE